MMITPSRMLPIPTTRPVESKHTFMEADMQCLLQPFLYIIMSCQENGTSPRGTRLPLTRRFPDQDKPFGTQRVNKYPNRYQTLQMVSIGPVISVDR